MKKLFPIAFILLFSAAARAQQPTPLSLEACYDYALKHSYTVKNAQLDVLIQQAQVDQTKSAAYPHVNGKVDFNNFNVPQRSFVDASSFSPGIPKGTIVPIAFTLPYAASAAVTTSQVFFDGSVLVALQARKAVMELAYQTEKVTEENLRYSIFKSYHSLVVSYHQFGLVKKSLDIARELEHDVLVTNQNGLAEKIDVERASVQVNNLANDSLRIGNMITLAEQVLKYQMGMDINAPIVLTDTSVEAHRTDALKLLEREEDYDRVPEFSLAKTALKLNEYNLRRYRLSAVPSLAGYWAYGSNYGAINASDLFKFNNYWASSTLGLSLNVPIFNGLMRVNQVHEAKLNIEKSQNNIDNLKYSLNFQATSARTALKNAILQTRSQRRNVDLSNDVLDLAQRKYKAGVGSNLEVTQAQGDLIRSENGYFSALLDIINAEADLKKALGLLK
jgi:outer membrane protein TolC